MTRIHFFRFKHAPLSEKGISLVEVLVTVALIGLISLALSINTINSLYIEKKVQLNYAASNLALSRVEELAAIDTLALDASRNSNENGLTVPGLDVNFTRTTTISVNGDNSRTVNVAVATDGGRTPAQASFTTIFVLWE